MTEIRISMMKNGITEVTRRHIADEMVVAGLSYHGNLTEPDFLARLYDLKSLSSKDSRYTNAYDDIYQHMVNNNDWDEDWIYTDPRINFLYCDDEIYLNFLAATVHPGIRTNSEHVSKLIKIYNSQLIHDGFELAQTDEISGKPVFIGRQKIIGQAQLVAKKIAIKRYLNTDYVNSKINAMTDAIQKDTGLAIGTAKELLETICKSILRQKKIDVRPDWTLPQLFKNTTNSLDFKPRESSNPKIAEKAIKQILSGVGTIVQGVCELRNGYGTGHGKDPDFKGLDSKYAKLLVGVVSEIAILYLDKNDETTELIETFAAAKESQPIEKTELT